MAGYDDRQWLLSLIQNAYVTSDDTGLCEVIIQEDRAKQCVAEFPFLIQTDDLQNNSADQVQSSPDITSDYNLTSHRHRSLTERKSDRLKKEREKASRVKRITWKNNEQAITESELKELFQRKAVICDNERKENGPKQTSLLSHLVHTSQDLSTNAFIEYSKFDGTTHNNVSRKQLNIFLYVGNNPCLDYPLPVSVISSARVVDLIGLICWIYTKENRQPPIKTIDHYQLHMADEDGQCDWEFQPLEKRDLIEKYGFTTLALVEKEAPESNQVAVVTVNFARGEFSKIEVSNKDVTLREILNRSINRRKELAKMKEAGVDYHLERQEEPGIELSLDKTISQVQCTEFALVRDHSKRTNGRDRNAPNIMEITCPQSFNVYWEKKFSKIESKLEISGDKMEVSPLTPKGGNSILSVRSTLPIRYRIDQLIDCEKRSLRRNKVELVVTIQGENSFKNFKFICDLTTGEELYDKCRALIRINAKRNREKKPHNSRRHNSLSLRKRTKSDTSAFEV